MEILFVSHKYPPATGGMEKQSLELIEGMKQHAKVHTLVYEAKESKIKFFHKLHSRIKHLCKKHPGISIIHFNDALLATFSLTIRIPRHLKRTMTVHGLDVVFPFFLYSRFIFPKFDKFDLIIAVSEATKNACIQRGIHENKLLVIANGVDTRISNSVSREEADMLLQKRFQLNSTGKTILVGMGRPVKRKGFSWFIRNVVPSLHENVLLLLIGPSYARSNSERIFRFLPGFVRKRLELFLGYPSDAVNIRMLLKDPSISSKVKHLGKLPLQDLTKIIGASDAYIMPNIPVKGDMEGFGLVCLEAAMCGTRVFASGLEGITDAIHHNKNGFLLPPADALSWIDALNQLHNKTNKFGLTPDEVVSFTAKTFSWQRMVDRYLKAFKKLVNEENHLETQQ